MSTTEWKELDVAEFWTPAEINDELTGKLAEVKDIDFDGEKIKNYVILTEKGQEITLKNHTVLMNKMKNVKLGQNVKIIYIGEELPKQKGHNPTKMYKVLIKE